ncbi:MAG TPA: MarR family transcriptional regulator [Polyangiaceae bacterium]
MHALYFRLKRAFQSTLRISRPALRHYGLTPARFDLLYAVQGADHYHRLERPPSMWQSALRRALGVTAATVSRMLRSLEELGLVRRWRDASDTRQRVVELTPEGYALLRLTMRRLMGSGAVELAVTSALVYPRFPLPSDFEDVGTIAAILYRLECVADCFRDTGSVDYPHEPITSVGAAYW